MRTKSQAIKSPAPETKPAKARPRGSSVVARLDQEVDAFIRRVRFFHEPLTKGRAHMFVLQHRQNTRQRNWC